MNAPTLIIEIAQGCYDAADQGMFPLRPMVLRTCSIFSSSLCSNRYSG
jgi:hypothetical protein